MKIKFEQKNKVDEELTLLGAMALGGAIAGVFGYLGKKFFSRGQKQVAAAGQTLEAATQNLENALKKEEEVNPAPQFKNVSQNIIFLKQKLIKNLKNIEKQTQDKSNVTKMNQKPSVIAQELVDDFVNEIEMQTAALKMKEGSALKKAVDKSISDMENALEIIKNIDKLVLLQSKEMEDGVWKTVVEKHFNVKEAFPTDDEWSSFINFLFNKYGTK